MKKNNKRAFSLIELSIVILIVGILIAGVTQSSRLVDASRVQVAQTTTESSPVSSLRGLVLWLETTAEKSFKASETDDEDPISIWYDTNPQVQHPNDLSVSESVNITYEESGINNLPTVQFSGSQSAGLSGSGITSSYLSYTVFVVYRGDTLADVNPLVYNGDSDSSATGFGIEDNGSGLISFHDGEDANFTAVTGAIPSIADAGRIATVTVSPNSVDGATATQNVSIYINGVSDVSATNLTNNLATVGADNLIVGYESGGTLALDGEVSELIIIDHVLKEKDRQEIEAYLGRKFGISVSKE